jgi:hypothetical protein
MGRGDKLCCVGPGARRDWCVTERGCQWEMLSAMAQEQVQCAMEAGASTLGDAARVYLTLGCGMGDAALGDVGRTLEES